MISDTGHNLVLVLGLPRSGTTLLCALLDNHPDVACPPEPWLLLALHALGHAGPAHPADAGLLAVATDELLVRLGAVDTRRSFAVAAYNRLLAALGGRVLVDKTPRYYHVLDDIEAVLPEARHVWIRRDPLDVVASYASSWNVDLATLIATDPGHPAALDIVLGPRRLEAFAARRAGHLHLVRYEDLVDDPRAAIDAVVAFLGLSPRDDLVRLDAAPGRSGLSSLSSTMGDTKIRATDGVHGRSVGTGLATLAVDQLQVLHDALGAELIARTCPAGTIETLRERGVVDRGPDATAQCVRRAEEALAARWAEVARPPATGALRQAVGRADQAEAEVHRRKDREVALTRERDALARERDALARDREATHAVLAEAQQAMEDRARWNAKSPRQRLRSSLRQAWHSALESVGGRRAPKRVSVTVITPLVGAPADLAVTTASVRRQRGLAVEHLVCGPPSVLTAVQRRDGDGADQLRLVETAEGANRIEALNAGLSAATGDVLTWLDPGDELEPGALGRVAETLGRRRRIQATYLAATVRRDGWRFPEPAPPVRDLFAALDGQDLPRGGVFIRRQPFRSIRRLDAARPLAAEYGLWLALSRWFRIASTPGQGRSVPLERVTDDAEARTQRQAVRDEFRRTMRWVTLARRRPRGLWRRADAAARRAVRPPRWDYPLERPGPAGSGKPAPAVGAAPAQPPAHREAPAARELDTARIWIGVVPDRLLLTVRDPRVGATGLCRIYLSEQRGMAWRIPAAYVTRCGAAADADPLFRGYLGGTRRLRRQAGGASRLRAGTAGDLADRIVDPQARLGDAIRIDPGGAAATLSITAPARDLGVVATASPAVDGGPWRAALEDVPHAVPDGLVFDLIDVAPSAGTGVSAERTIRRLFTMLAPGGRLVVALPNLDSAMLELFGPTWALWHDPGHATYVRRSALGHLVAGTDLRVARVLSVCDAGSTARTLGINEAGIDADLGPAWTPSPGVERRATDLVAAGRRYWDDQGRGDWLIAVFERPRIT